MSSQKIYPNASTDCFSCSIGKFSSVGGQSQCNDCVRGRTSDSTLTTCVDITSYSYQNRTLYDIGCADGTREFFFDINTHPLIAGCSGAWSVPGVKKDSFSASTSTTCNRMAGNTGQGTLLSGTDCPASDLCAEGWRICSSSMDVTTMSRTYDCDDFGNQYAEPDAAFISAQSGAG